ncbi:MAG: type II toxin-antitoxin system RelE family toxin [Sandaracinobacter sp.]
MTKRCNLLSRGHEDGHLFPQGSQGAGQHRPSQALAIRSKIAQLAADPASLANNIKALKGQDAKRLRVGDYRVIFNDRLEILDILAIGHRRDIYD